MRGAGIRVVVVLIALAALMAQVSTAHAQSGGRRGQGGGGGGRGRNAPPQSQSTDSGTPGAKEELPPGEYALDFEQALQAVNRGEGRQALAFYERVAAEAEQQGDRVRAARANHAAAAVASRIGLFQKVIVRGNRAIDLFMAVGPANLEASDLGRIVSAHSLVGSAYRAVGDQAKARKVLEEGLAFAEANTVGNREGVMTGLLSNGLALVAFAQKDYQTALARANQAAQILDDATARLKARTPERRRAQIRRVSAQSLVIAAKAQSALGHADGAEAAFDKALKYARAANLRDFEVEALQGQAHLALSRQEWSKAQALYQQAIGLANQLNRPMMLVWLNQGLSRALSGLGRPEEALAAARESVRGLEAVRGELGDSELRSSFLEDKQSLYFSAIRLALDAQHPEEAFELAERSRARAFLDLLGNQTVLSKGRTRALVDEEVRLRAKVVEAEARVQETGSDEGEAAPRAIVDAAEREYRAFLERVRKENLEQASLMAVEPVTVPEIQRLLPQGTTLLEYLVIDDLLVVWVLDRQHVKAIRLPGDRQSLIAEVRHLRGAIVSQAAFANVEAQARGLYGRLIEPARGEIHGERLLIVPHGVLHYLPFAALRSPAGQWLIEDFAIGTLPSASVLRYLNDKGVGASDRALVVGNPDLGAGMELRWAEREARMVGQQEPQATVLVRADATEAQVKKLIETAGVVHFATHGELDESDPLASALLLAPGGGEDGRFEVRELFGFDLHARLVVLSACETGLGKLSRGDEIVGLQRAFIYAGTPAVVTTLWKVDDRASFELIRAFYERLGREGPTQALRQAQLTTMRSFPHPFAWAAFGLTGAPR